MRTLAVALALVLLGGNEAGAQLFLDAGALLRCKTRITSDERLKCYDATVETAGVIPMSIHPKGPRLQTPGYRDVRGYVPQGADLWGNIRRLGGPSVEVVEHLVPKGPVPQAGYGVMMRFVIPARSREYSLVHLVLLEDDVIRLAIELDGSRPKVVPAGEFQGLAADPRPTRSCEAIRADAERLACYDRDARARGAR